MRGSKGRGQCRVSVARTLTAMHLLELVGGAVDGHRNRVGNGSLELIEPIDVDAPAPALAVQRGGGGGRGSGSDSSRGCLRAQLCESLAPVRLVLAGRGRNEQCGCHHAWRSARRDATVRRDATLRLGLRPCCFTLRYPIHRREWPPTPFRHGFSLRCRIRMVTKIGMCHNRPARTDAHRSGRSPDGCLHVSDAPPPWHFKISAQTCCNLGTSKGRQHSHSRACKSQSRTVASYNCTG